MIIGVGIDVVGIDRFAAALRRTPSLSSRLFTERERALPASSLAARFAAKEALAKALGAPRGLLWTDAEVVSSVDGRPFLEVTGTVAAAARLAGVTHWHLSLSHDAGIASAVVIAEAVVLPRALAVARDGLQGTLTPLTPRASDAAPSDAAD